MQERLKAFTDPIGRPGMEHEFRQTESPLADFFDNATIALHWRRRSVEAGFDAHLVKPVDPTALLQVISSRAQAPQVFAEAD